MDQDFSFPTINDSFSNYSIDSPPLWNLSPSTSPNPYGGLSPSSFIIKHRNEEEEEAEKEEGKRSRSLSCIEIHSRRRRDHDDDDDDDEKEKKMDLLWENFNEELLCSTSRTTTSTTTSREEEEVELRKVGKRRSNYNYNNNNNNALLLPTKNKPGMVVFVKVLKKLFSLTNSQANPRKRV